MISAADGGGAAGRANAASVNSDAPRDGGRTTHGGRADRRLDRQHGTAAVRGRAARPPCGGGPAYREQIVGPGRHRPLRRWCTGAARPSRRTRRAPPRRRTPWTASVPPSQTGSSARQPRLAQRDDREGAAASAWTALPGAVCRAQGVLANAHMIQDAQLVCAPEGLGIEMHGDAQDAPGEDLHLKLEAVHRRRRPGERAPTADGDGGGRMSDRERLRVGCAQRMRPYRSTAVEAATVRRRSGGQCSSAIRASSISRLPALIWAA